MTQLFDPISASSSIIGDYQRYLRSLLPLDDVNLSNALDRAITSEATLHRGPILESTPAYVRGSSINDLIDEGVLPIGFRRLDSPALPMERQLYAHQEQATRKARDGRSLVVSTGTGSGKTESFLIPILASLTDESDQSPLAPGIRALLLYPMNALANDQIKRLRQILASTPDITFGRYIGDTPRSAKEAESMFRQLNPGEPRLPNELLSREEMQSNPPHLLLTNYAMLEYLLLRPDDMDLFEGAHSGHWKFLIVDEAHVYHGARGSELAMLLRRLQSRVGANNLQCIATSATVGADSNPKAVTDFATNLFGTPVEWVPTDASRQDLVSATRLALPQGVWGPMSPDDYRELATSPDLHTFLAKFSSASPGTNSHDLLATEIVMANVRQHLSHGAESLSQLIARLGPDWSAADIRNVVDVGGRVADETGVPLLSARYHLWLRSTEGAFMCLSVKDPHVYLSRQEECLRCQRPAFEFGGCTRCGTTYILGKEEAHGASSRLAPRIGHSDLHTWIALTTDTHSDDEDELVWEEDLAEIRDAIEICSDCGLMNPQGALACGSCGGLSLRSGRVIRGHSRRVAGCVVCGSRTKGQVRLFDTGADAAAAVIATSLYQHLPVDTGPAADNPGGGRKLLAFSDSRQGAAFFAPYLGSSYKRLLQRRLLLQGIEESCALDRGPSRLDDVIANASRIATNADFFARRDSRQSKEREIGLWLAQELVAFDTRQSLEGLGLINLHIEGLSRIASQPIWGSLGLSPDQAEDLLTELLVTLRSQGAVSFPEGVDPSDEAFAPRLGPIYVRERQSDKRVLSWIPTAGVNRRMDYLSRVLAASGATMSATEVLAGIWRLLTTGNEAHLTGSNHPRHGQVFQLDYTWILVNPGAADAELFRCSQCAKTFTRNVLDVCPTLRCGGTLVLAASDPNRLADNHYAHLYRNLLPVPLKVEEHTAQWSATEAAAIQNQFIRGEVNALSCSTTFELGVDVGDLQAVLLRNVPPATANYVQRAGRAGRRTASAALVVTFAQRKSHDLSRFQEPETMINGAVSPPLIPLGNERIDRRHAHSVALSSFFRHVWLTSGVQWRKVGEFFSPEGSAPDPMPMLRAYLDSAPAEVTGTLRTILPSAVQEELDLSSGAWVNALMDHLAKVQAEVQQEVDYFEDARRVAFESRKDALASQFGRVLSTIRKRDLLGFLGSRNILPKYGFPVDVVELRTQTSANAVGTKLDLSRDLSTAVFEYAPGSEIVAGGWLWKSAGIYRLPERDLVHGWFANCLQCQFFEAGLTELDLVCPSCAGDRRPQRYMIPEFGFIAERTPTKPTGTPPQRSWNGGTHFVSSGRVVEPGPHWAPTPSSIVVEASQRAKLMAVSTSATDQGYLICDWCGRGLPTSGKTPKKHDHAWKDQECTGHLTRAALAHSYETDVLTVEFRVNPQPTFTQAWSLLYGLLDAASHVLGIARDDIDGTLWFTGGVPHLVLFDTVPGGAGCVLQIPTRLPDILERARRKLSACECGEETSCYSCLRTYRNSIRHDILSRGSAVALLATLS